MFDAQKAYMLLKPENRALRALLWLVIILVPGGLLLLGLLAADTLHRRYREGPRLAETDLAEGPLSGLNSSRG
jgi:cytochrome c-type biogenesis protein CcmH/NrfF